MPKPSEFIGEGSDHNLICALNHQPHVGVDSPLAAIFLKFKSFISGGSLIW